MPRVIFPRVEYAQIEMVQQKVSWEEAVSIGMELRSMKDKSQWELGDLASLVSKGYGTDALGKFANDIGINKKSLQQYRRVAQAFPKSKRIDLLSHRHHLMLAARKDKLEWLKKAADNTWTTSQLERELLIASGKEPKVKHSPLAYCPKCKKLLVGLEDICRCGKEK